MLHLSLHFLVPALLAVCFPASRRGPVFVWLMLGMLIDLDHLLADPIYDPKRCSIGFHPLHTTWPILGYLSLLAWQHTRILGVGLVIHISLDAIDYL